MDNKNKVPEIQLYTGERIPCIGMGTFGSDKYDAKQISQAVYGAIETGYRLFDCASVYGNEKQIGEVFHKAFRDDLVKREELHITSKVWNDKHSPEALEDSLHQTLKDLQLSYVDTYFIHWPFPNYHAPGCDGDARNPDSKPFSLKSYIKIWRKMEELQKLGLTRNIGMSNMTIPKLEAILPLCQIRPMMLEMELHPSFQQPELFAYAVKNKIQPIGFCPIGSPSRPARDKFPDDVVDVELPAIKEIAEKRGKTPAQVCLAWAIQAGAIPIPFSTTKKHYDDNLKSSFEICLTEEEMKAIKDCDANCRLVKGQVFLWENANGWEDLWDLDGTITK